MPEDAPFRSGTVAIVGRPNAGKSTLLNRLVGEELAVVTAKPQTTRDRILAIANVDRAQIVLVDTPGFHKPRSELNQSMVRATVNALSEVDAALVMVELHKLPKGVDPAPGIAVRELIGRVAESSLPAVLALNKVDKVPKTTILLWIQALAELYDWAAVVPISAKDGDNLQQLTAEIAQMLPEQPALYPDEMITDRSERFFMAELIREQVIRATRDEVPYSVGIEIEEFLDKPTRTFVRATILVERDSQKGIIVGRGGKTIGAIGTAARLKACEFLQRQVDLKLFVKVSKDWTTNPNILKNLGYE